VQTKLVKTITNEGGNKESINREAITNSAGHPKVQPVSGKRYLQAVPSTISPMDILTIQRRVGNQAAISITRQRITPRIQRLVSSKDFTKSTRLSFWRKGKSSQFFQNVIAQLQEYETLVSKKADDSTKKVKLHGILNLLNGWMDTEGKTSSRLGAVKVLKTDIQSEVTKNTAVSSDD
jgi:hypothetical protein